MDDPAVLEPLGEPGAYELGAGGTSGIVEGWGQMSSIFSRWERNRAGSGDEEKVRTKQAA
jgi:hypothetical protein